jgi:hypothetical protein
MEEVMPQSSAAVLRIYFAAATSCVLLVSAGHAAECASRLQVLQERASGVLESAAERGRSAGEGKAATMHRQPTPRSIAEAEEKLGELPREKVEAFRSALLRARTAEAAGDETGCLNAAGVAESLLRGE